VGRKSRARSSSRLGVIGHWDKNPYDDNGVFPPEAADSCAKIGK
jgi:hypothetical protein